MVVWVVMGFVSERVNVCHPASLRNARLVAECIGLPNAMNM
jgi:hypothetical protein